MRYFAATTRFVTICLLLAIGLSCSHAQTFKLLHNFGDVTLQEGIRPAGALVVGHDFTLYGTTSEGPPGALVRGAIFKFAARGKIVSVVKQFTNLVEGVEPRGGLAVGGDTLYGITTIGGTENGGTIFSVNTNGSNYTVLRNLPPRSHNRSLSMGALLL